MSFVNIAKGTAVFVDANVFVYYFAPDPQFGPACKGLLERVELHELQGFTSSQVVSDVAHRLMSLEACATFGWPYQGIAARMQKHPADVQRLKRFRIAVESIIAMDFRVLAVTGQHVLAATAMSQQYGILSNDALVVAVMQDNGLTQLASNDDDFDRVSGITRFTPT